MLAICDSDRTFGRRSFLRIGSLGLGSLTLPGLLAAKAGAAPLQVPGVTARVAAARVLDAVLHHGRSLKAELAQALPSLADPRDRALVEAICFAVLRSRHRGDAALAAWIPRPLRDPSKSLMS